MTASLKTLTSALLFGAVLAIASNASAQVPYDVLPQHASLRHRPTCSHVIEMMMHNQFTGGKLSPTLVGSPYGPPVLIQPQVGDLELVSVQLICEAAEACGPKFAVTFTNNSEHDVQCLHISLVAVLCKIDCFDPTTTVKIECLKAHETATMEIALPQTAMAMPTENQCLAEFDTLVVAIDAYDAFLECDECNNIQVLKRAEIPAIVVETTAVEAPQIEGTEPGADLPQAELPGEVQKPSPLDNIDLDQLQLDEADGTAVRIDW